MRRGMPKKDSISTEDDEFVKAQVKTLLDEMDDAFNTDRKANEEKRPAIRRLLLLDKIDTALRRHTAHEYFVNMSGLDRLYNWLVAMPDGTYPNTKIVQCVLEQLDRLDLKQEDLGNRNDLENALDLYTNVSGVLSSGYKECADLARAILNKWNRTKYGITTRYDEAGDFDIGWQQLKRQLDDAKEPVAKRQRVDEPGSAKQRSNAPHTLGGFMKDEPLTNFVNRPDPHSGLDESMMRGGRSGGKESQSTWSRLKKSMLKLKKGKGAGFKPRDKTSLC
jgi:hypothetical protein